MVFFLNFATDWSYTSVFLQHVWINWVTRGLCKFHYCFECNRSSRAPRYWVSANQFEHTRSVEIHFQNIILIKPADVPKVDDMFLDTDIYSPNGTKYQVTTDDLDEHIQWMADINTRLTLGSNYFIEIGHNGNGNIEVLFLLSP
jgi:hypothetical protein